MDPGKPRQPSRTRLGTRAPGEAPDGLSIALRDYLILFSEPKIDMMQDGDTALLAELDALLDQLAALPADPRRTVIHDQVADLRENWYGD